VTWGARWGRSRGPPSPPAPPPLTNHHRPVQRAGGHVPPRDGGEAGRGAAGAVEALRDQVARGPGRGAAVGGGPARAPSRRRSDCSTASLRPRGGARGAGIGHRCARRTPAPAGLARRPPPAAPPPIRLTTAPCLSPPAPRGGAAPAPTRTPSTRRAGGRRARRAWQGGAGARGGRRGGRRGAGEDVDAGAGGEPSDCRRRPPPPGIPPWRPPPRSPTRARAPRARRATSRPRWKICAKP